MWIRDTIAFDLVWASGALGSSTNAPLPRFNDVVAYVVPHDSIRAFKRVLGLPGDTLEMRNGSLLRNGTPVLEPYIQHTKPGFRGRPEDLAAMRTWQLPHLVGRSPTDYSPDVQNWGPLLVPPTAVAVFGDNRDQSYDTRYVGFIPFASLMGRVLQVRRPGHGIVWQREASTQ